MAQTINFLPKEVYDLIQAGEIIESPESVVRELIDNALDAGASYIKIEIQEGGKKLISVEDNGKGMSLDDLLICFLPHTTSKIHSFQDLATLSTQGFRGEALASISKVAQLRILSGQADQEFSHEIQVRDQSILKQSSYPARQGSKFIVSQLFYNIPVRQKFLKSKKQEERKIIACIQKKALLFPHIQFEIFIDDKLSLSYPPQSQESRVLQILDLPRVIPIQATEGDIQLEAYISGIENPAPNMSDIFIFVNARPLISKSLFGAIKYVFQNLLPRGYYPMGCFFFTVPAGAIDVNVHPSKQNVYTSREGDLSQLLKNALIQEFQPASSPTWNKSLDTDPQTIQDTISLQSLPKMNPYTILKSRVESSSPSFLDTGAEKEKSYFAAQAPGDKDHLNAEFHSHPSSENLASDSSASSQDRLFSQASSPFEGTESFSYQGWKWVGSLFDTYWVVEIMDKVYFIDFHAAHERYRFETLKWNIVENSLLSITLPKPITLRFPLHEIEVLERCEAGLQKLGYDFQILTDNQVIFHKVPEFYHNDHSWQKDITEILASGLSSEEITVEQTIQMETLKRIACRYSYMSKDFVEKSEIQKLVNLIFMAKIPWTCPHGRPFIFELDQKDLASLFLRV